MKITERLPQESGRDYACRIIKENIISLDLAPGCLVSEKELAQQLSLSRTPVREALIDLAKVGIVEVLPQRGSRISYIDYQLVDEARFARSALEVALCQKICPNADLSLLAPLTENILLQEQCLAQDDPQTFFYLDNEFHRLMFEIGGMSRTYEIISGLTVHFDRVRSMSLYVVKPDQLLIDHKAIIYALLSHDQDLVSETVEAHLCRYRIDKAAIQQQYPSYFKPEQA
ncbi:MAG: GntR family transcriptional regulator [Candidatus Onthomonas sp.]